MNIKETILEKKIIAIIRGVTSDHIVQTVQALLDGGICCVEVTYDQMNESGISETLKSIGLLKKTFGEKLALGAGTVLTTGQADSAAAAGAEYIISPNTDTAVIKRTKELGKVSIPGALTPTEVVKAYNAGADIIKIFPVGNLGLGYIKALCGPLGYIPMLAVGGVSPENIKDFIDSGVCGVGIGSNLVNTKLIAAGHYDEIARLAKIYVSALGKQG